jgi:predicted Fe-S protein YdhL (DUF1289 family)
MARIYSPAEIEDPAAYDRAIRDRIRGNARKTRSAAWQAATPDHEMIRAALWDRQGRSEFCAKMLDSLNEWGSLTPGQEAAVRRILAQEAARKEERLVARKAEAAGSVHIGTVGARVELSLVVSFTTSFETQFGTLHIAGMKDAQGNIVIYKGNKFLGERGVALKGKATIKEHGERDGAKQTIIARPALSPIGGEG